MFNEEQFDDDVSCRVDTGGITNNQIDQCRNKFVWVDGSTRTNLQPWRNQEPNTDNDKCVRLERDQWAASPCHLELGYICREGKLNRYVYLIVAELFCNLRLHFYCYIICICKCMSYTYMYKCRY